MTLYKLCLLTALLTIWMESEALSTTGEKVHCLGDRAHLLKYDVEGEPNDGSSLQGITKAVLSMEPSAKHAAMCGDVAATTEVGSAPSGDKKFCYGFNQDSSCTAAKADIPLENGKFDCKDCFVGATADLYYKLNYTWDKLYSVEVGLQDMHLRGSVALHTFLSGSVTPVKGTKVLADNSTRFTLIDELVGCPICVKAKVTVATPTSVDYELTLKAQADIEAGAEIDIDLGDKAIKWDYIDGWTHPEKEPSYSVKPILAIGDTQAEADVSLGVHTSLQVDLDDIIWYHLDVHPSLPLKCTVKGALWPFHGAQFCLNGDAAVTIGHEADLHWNLLTFHENHHWGPYNDYSWSKSGIVNTCKDIKGPGNVSSVAAVVV